MALDNNWNFPSQLDDGLVKVLDRMYARTADAVNQKADTVIQQRDPNEKDTHYVQGTTWINEDSDAAWILTSKVSGVATYTPIT